MLVGIPGKYDHWAISLCQAAGCRLWLLLPLFLVLYWSFDSYPGISVNPVAEIRRISLANALAFLFISVILLLHQAAVVPQLDLHFGVL